MKVTAVRARLGSAELHVTWPCAAGEEDADRLAPLGRALVAALAPGCVPADTPPWRHFTQSCDWTHDWWHMRLQGDEERGLFIVESSQAARDGTFRWTRLEVRGLPEASLTLVADSRDGRVRLDVTGSRDGVAAVAARVPRT